MNAQSTGEASGVTKYIATGIAALVASLLGSTILAVGSAINSHNVGIAELVASNQRVRDDIFELHGTLSLMPSPSELQRCAQRIEVLEQQRARDQHRLDIAEQRIAELIDRAPRRYDSYGGPSQPMSGGNDGGSNRTN